MSQASWTEVGEFVGEVAERTAGTEFTGVYGIPRGGCVLAVMLSHRLGIPYLGAPCKGCLVVDDISDSGAALSPFLGRYTTAAMHFREGTSAMPDIVHSEAEDWVVYPWEASGCSE